MSPHRSVVVPETSAGGVGQRDVIPDPDRASREAFARFGLPRDSGD
jgi:hypothetical protein